MYRKGEIFESDLDEILESTKDECLHFKNQELTVLGGTGFIGTWIISFLCFANEVLNLNLKIITPTRDINTANKKLKLTNNDPVELVKFDFSIDKKTFITQSKFYIIGITPTVKSTGSKDNDLVLMSTYNTIDFINRSISQSKNLPHVLHLSSGAVYQDFESPEIFEKKIEFLQSKDTYTQAKFTLEKSLEKLNDQNLIKATNPRLFAFMGPHLALDEHFAIGNFIKYGIDGNPILVKGNPLTTRSYLYPTDLITWIIKLLVNPTIAPLNFGSDQKLTIEQIAKKISIYFGDTPVIFGNPEIKKSHYVPNIENTKGYLNVTQKVYFDEGIKRWVKWLKR